MPAACRWLVVTSAVLALSLAGSSAQAAAADKPKPEIQVTLRFSVTELDPTEPKDSYVECVVRNDSARSVRVPTVYNAGFDRDIILRGGAVWLVYWGKAKKQEYATLEPGKEMSIFKAPLKALLLDPIHQPGNGRWTWEA
jgi:hypothetical protein